MNYHYAIDILAKLDITGQHRFSDEEVLAAVETILGMETINAVPKVALLNALRWFWANCVEEEMTVVEHTYTTPEEKAEPAKDKNVPTYDLLYEEGGPDTR